MTHLFDAAILSILAFIAYTLHTYGRSLMATQDDVNALTAQVGKIQDEVAEARDLLLTKLADVQAQLDAAGATNVDLSELTSAIQALDDLNPDA